MRSMGGVGSMRSVRRVRRVLPTAGNICEIGRVVGCRRWGRNGIAGIVLSSSGCVLKIAIMGGRYVF